MQPVMVTDRCDIYFETNPQKAPSLKIYTKTGDDGETGLLGGIRVRKSHPTIETCGSLDEINSLIGVAIATGTPPSISPLLSQIQNDLFDLGSRVAASQAANSKAAEFSSARAEQLEQWIDQFDEQLPPLREFILPGGSPAGANLHLARTVCRRAERDLVRLMASLPDLGSKPMSLSIELIYLNRLSDLLFVLARWVNVTAGVAETKWRVTR